MAEEPSTDDTTDASTDDQAVACSLTADEARDRMDWAEDALLPYLQDSTIADDHLTWTFERTDEAIAGATELVRRETACCAFATIELTVPPEGPITFHMDVPEGTGEALATQFEDVVDLRELA